jgi:hypothetical protein
MEPGNSSASAGLPSANIGKSMKGSSSFTDFIEPGQLPDVVDLAEVLGRPVLGRHFFWVGPYMPMWGAGSSHQ